jgi:formylmethanofuran:tetrahydromethanopterin formyltransferase
MAQSLESRINSALRSAARLKDVQGVITDVEAEIASTRTKLEAENARSIDPALTTPQAREAATTQPIWSTTFAGSMPR